MVVQYNPIAGMCMVYRAVVLGTSLVYPWWVYCGIWGIMIGLLWYLTWYLMQYTRIIRS
jgi:ABC-type polysaccharide/polyol phosphate export permease